MTQCVCVCVVVCACVCVCSLVCVFTCVRAGGDQTSVLVETVMSGRTMGNLIQEPTGCGEQIMTTMTLPVIATRYLDTTRQWESIGLEKRATAIEYIRLGRARLASSLTRVSSVNTYFREAGIECVSARVPEGGSLL